MSFTNMDVKSLVDATDEEFRTFVDGEVRGSVDGQSVLLRDPQITERWYYVLLQMKKSVESQLSSKRSDVLKLRSTLTQKAYDEKLAEFHRWKAGAVRFKSGVEERLLEIRKDTAVSQNRTLREAILTHRERVLKEFKPDEVSDADTALWKTIET